MVEVSRLHEGFWAYLIAVGKLSSLNIFPLTRPVALQD